MLITRSRFACKNRHKRGVEDVAPYGFASFPLSLRSLRGVEDVAPYGFASFPLPLRSLRGVEDVAPYGFVRFSVISRKFRASRTPAPVNIIFCMKVLGRESELFFADTKNKGERNPFAKGLLSPLFFLIRRACPSSAISRNVPLRFPLPSGTDPSLFRGRC